MCRIQICMTKGEMQDSDAFIGYDRPMRTFFIQGFLKDFGDYEDFEIWLGADLEEFPTLEGIIEAAKNMGYRIGSISYEDQMSLMLAAGLIAEPSLAERLGWFQK